MIDQRNEAAARQARHHGAIERHGREHDEEGRGEQPLQIAHAAGDAHLVAQRAQHVIAGEQAEEIGEGPQQGLRLAGAQLDDAPEPFLQSGNARGHAQPFAVGWRGCTQSWKSGKLFHAGSGGSTPGRGA